MYVVIGTSVVRVVATFESPEEAAALASRWNVEDTATDRKPRTPTLRELFRVDV